MDQLNNSSRSMELTLLQNAFNLDNDTLTKLRGKVRSTRRNYPWAPGMTVHNIMVISRGKGKKRVDEDSVYCGSKALQRWIPRALSVITNRANEVIATFCGPSKFSDLTGVYDHDVTVDAARRHELVVLKTEKLNGKMAVFGKFIYNDEQWVAFGSKNVMVPVRLSDFGSIDLSYSDITSILRGIHASLLLQMDFLMDTSTFDTTMVGELCDSLHFTDGDNQVHWFCKVSKDVETLGKAVNPLETLESFGPHGVSSEVVFTPSSDLETLPTVLNLGRNDVSSEGSVLYMIVDGLCVQMLKRKSTWYKLLRTTRQTLTGWGLGAGFHNMNELPQKVKDRADYLGLIAQACDRGINIIYEFAHFLREMCLPLENLGIDPGPGLRGMGNHWRLFVTTRFNGVDPLTFTDEDYGPFISSDFHPTLFYNTRPMNESPDVLFFVGPQGCGKSTLARYMDTIGFGRMIEQDQFQGSSRMTQSVFRWMIEDSNGPTMILLSRCNVEPLQYNSFLRIAYNRGCRVFFIRPDVDGLLDMSLQGVEARSSTASDGMLVLGSKELPREEVTGKVTEFYEKMVDHYRGDEPWKQNVYQWRTPENERRTVEDIAEEILTRYSTGRLHQREPEPTRVLYSGFFVDPQVLTGLPGVDICQIPESPHVTETFVSGHWDKPKSRAGEMSEVGTVVDIELLSVVTNTETGGQGLRVRVHGHDNLNNRHPHITTFIPDGGRAVDTGGFIGSSDGVQVEDITPPRVIQGVSRRVVC